MFLGLQAPSGLRARVPKMTGEFIITTRGEIGGKRENAVVVVSALRVFYLE